MHICLFLRRLFRLLAFLLAFLLASSSFFRSSFSVLGSGHFMLGLSSSYSGVLVASVLFGLGEGISTGLRALNKRDYNDELGPIGQLSAEFFEGRSREATAEAEAEFETKIETKAETESEGGL